MIKKSMHRKLYEYVVEEIGLRITKGRIQPGDTLPNEEALCDELGVSRGVLREATKVLAQKGLIRVRPKTGTLVCQRGEWNLFDADVLIWNLKTEDQLEFLQKVTEVRSIIESEAARYAAERADALEVKAIRDCFETLHESLADEAGYDYAVYLEADMAFHTAIMDGCHNELLAQIGHTMRRAVQTARKADVRELKVLRASLPFHQEMLRAIQKHDAAAAHLAARAMFEQVWRSIPK
jgi:DNA-binding FadR family transcriptional regulator